MLWQDIVKPDKKLLINESAKIGTESMPVMPNFFVNAKIQTP